MLELELGAMEDELKILIGKMRYRSSFGQNALQHSKEVALLAGLIAEQLGGIKNSLEEPVFCMILVKRSPKSLGEIM